MTETQVKEYLSEEIRRKWLAVDRIVATPSGKSMPTVPREVVEQQLWGAAEYLVRSGVLDHVVELLATIAMLHDVVTDRMVDVLAKNVIRPLGLLIDGLTRTSLVEAIGRALADPELEKALVEAKEDKKISIRTLISLLNDAEVRRGLYITLVLLKALGKSAKEI
jgi:uncharacterized protein YjgD (DUF1641 family)